MKLHSKTKLHYGGTEPINVLYLGMATDIMAPMLLVPDFDNIYVISLVDRAFGGSWEEQKMRIRIILKDGSDKNVEKSEWWYEPYKTGHPPKENHTLVGPSKIIYDFDNRTDNKPSNYKPTEYDTYAKWELHFEYNGKIRKLIYYYDVDFNNEIWPKNISNINHILWNGTYSWWRIMEDDSELLRKMMMERLATGAYLYALSFNHQGFPEHILIYDGHERDGTLVAKMKLDFSNPEWWKKNYENP
jgi:hypothetical protein